MPDLVPFTASCQALAAASDMSAIVADNFSDGGSISFSDLTRFKVGAGGITLFTRIGTGPDGQPTEDHVKEIEAIVIERRSQQAYWPVAYGEGGDLRPDCRSTDGIFGIGNNGSGEGRHVCAKCPNNQFGSKIGKNGKPQAGRACREVRVFFLIAKDTPGIFPSVLIVPPGSFGNLTRYAAALTNQGKSFSTCVHRFTLDKARTPDGTEYAQLRAALVREQMPEERAEVRRYYEAMHPLLVKFYEQSADASEDAPRRTQDSDPLPTGQQHATPPPRAAQQPSPEVEFEVVADGPKGRRK